MSKKLWNRCVSAESNIEISSIFNNYINELLQKYSDDTIYVKTELQDCIYIIDDYIKGFESYIMEEEAKLKEPKVSSIDTNMSMMVINTSKEKIPLFRFLKNYVENKISELQLTSSPVISPTAQSEKEDNSIEINQIIQDYIDSKFKFDPNKKVYSREEACEYLQISDRKLTTLLERKIKPVSTAVKPYTFNIEELERYRKEEM
ncbi:hypothetical protein [Dysgonomonas sp. 511]|uniref:hypothetical protein n=1 Tax=Dysgonomonas sp. 511 TaxID=2302930 RepID=UPI0013D030D9|nr:hypothetical protein [Dysgonomonas sp. 511]NDV80100.1 hypothetical protein [Dysgonomonas sp. 511]